MTVPLSRRVGAGQSALLCAPPMHQSVDDACTELLLPADGDRPSALWVSYTRVPTARIRSWLSAVETPGNVGVVSVGERTLEDVRDIEGLEDSLLETVTTPGDLTGLGITLQNALEGWEGDVALCFDSLTSLLQYVDLETAYEFLHVLTGRLYAQDVVAHFHIDPEAHDDRTVAALTSLMDAVVSVDETGEVAVESRLPSEP